MLDTIAITLSEQDFKITDHYRFSPNSKNLFEPPYIRIQGGQLFKSVGIITKEDKRLFKYVPRITIFKAVRKNGFQIFLRIEFSAPKLLLGNNFEEIENKDLGKLCLKLELILEALGVKISSLNTLLNAKVSTVHYSKNILLTDFSTPSIYLQEIGRINLTRLLDVTKSDYRNEGHAIRFINNGFELIFYDKLKDLYKSQRTNARCIEQDSKAQLNFLEKLELIRPLEILRMEMRLGNRKKIRYYLDKNGFQGVEMTLESMFKADISRRLLLNMIEKIELAYPKLLRTRTTNYKEFLIELILKNPTLRHSQLLRYVGLKALLDEMNIREFRELTQRFGDPTWYRLNAEIQSLNQCKKVDYFTRIYDEIHRFEKVHFD